MIREANWAGNLAYAATAIRRPRSVPELQELVAASAHVRALGSRHSFSEVADAQGLLVTVDGLPSTVTVDPARSLATVSAGMTYGKIAEGLHEQGWALANLASLPGISVAGACATGTHGSGDTNQGLACAVQAMTSVAADGALVEVSPEADTRTFAASRIGLGGMGIVVAVTLAIQPAYEVEQQVYVGLGFEAFGTHLDEVFASAYSVSLFTDFRRSRFTQVWCKHRGTRRQWPTRWLGAAKADISLHPIVGMDATSCTPQQAQPGPWHERLPHFRHGRPPSQGAELQSEYFVARADAGAAFEALTRVVSTDHASPLMVCELRSIAADDLWLSPARARDTVAFHFTWQRDVPAVGRALTAIEAELQRFDARPHWGKVHRFSPDRLLAAYPRLVDFEVERRRIDPSGVFGNPFLDGLSAVISRNPSRGQ